MSGLSGPEERERIARYQSFWRRRGYEHGFRGLPMALTLKGNDAATYLASYRPYEAGYLAGARSRGRSRVLTDSEQEGRA